jgi:L-asparagine transporter-like permease
MINKYWFKPKRYGYGAMPTSREGWLVTLVFILITLYTASHFESNSFQFILILTVLIIILIVVAKKKTDGEWKWRWGNN